MALWINDGLHEAAQGIRSFLLVGQSNMAGRGDLTPENTITAPDCFMLRMGRWQPMSEPINVDRAVAEGAVPRSGANLLASLCLRQVYHMQNRISRFLSHIFISLSPVSPPYTVLTACRS